MPIQLGSNIASLKAQARLSDSSSAFSRSLERLSSGMRVNRASDDAAGLAIASSLRADTRVYAQALRNINDGVSALNIAQGALNELTTISIRQRELAEQAANGTYSLTQRKAMNVEANALVNEFNRIIESVKFNGTRLIDGSLDELRIQAGYGIDGSVSFAIGAGLERVVGTGTFGSSVTVDSGGVVYQSVSAYVNSDGKLDLVTANSGGAVRISIGNGDGPLMPSIITIRRDTYLRLR